MAKVYIQLNDKEYPVNVYPLGDNGTGGYIAEMEDFEHIMACGETAKEAAEDLASTFSEYMRRQAKRASL